MKRPIGNATCKSKCGPKEPQRLIDGTVCYCDGRCCPDYPEQCLKMVMPECLDAMEVSRLCTQSLSESYDCLKLH